MARAQDTTARAQRLIPLAAVALLAFAAAFAFGRVFQGHVPTWELVAAALVSVLVAAATERRGMLVATLASAAALILLLTWLVLPQTTWYGVPTIRTLRALGRSLEFVGQQARVQVAPTPPLTPLMLAAVTAVWTTAYASYALAVRAGSPLLAVLPPVALVGFADIVLEDGVRPIYAIVFLLAVLALVLADGLRRIRQWGPVWSGPYPERPLRSSTAHSVERVALIAIAAAVLVPGLLPGFRSDALLDLSSPGGETVRIDPFVSIQNSLNLDAPIELFTVTSPGAGAYWRLFALDRFDGTRWQMSSQDLSGQPTYGSPAQLLPSGGYPPNAPAIPQRFRTVTDLGDRWIPMAYPAQTLVFPEGDIRYDANLGAAEAPSPLDKGLEYTVASRAVDPTPQQLNAVTRDAFEAALPFRRYTYVPASIDPRVGQIAAEWTQGKTTPYQQVYAIMQHLRGPAYSYDIHADLSEDPDALLRFLTTTRTGFCQQFSAAMAVLVRELGYPARIAVGYRPGKHVGDTFTVGTQDAHSWVEVYFPGYGWLTFEPTPPVTSPLALTPGTYLNPAAPGAGGGPGGGAAAGGEQGGAATGGRLPGQLRSQDVLRERRHGEGGRGPTGLLPESDVGAYPVPYRWILVGLLIVLGLLAILVPTGKAAWRHRMLRRHRQPTELVLAVYRVFDGEAADLGLGRRDGETLTEYRDRVLDEVTFSDGHLGVLTDATSRAAYSAGGLDRGEALQVADAARVAIRDMRRSAGIVRRVTGLYRPGF